MQREVIRSQGHQAQVCLLFIDIDHFKKLNDDYGHSYGDEVLGRVGKVLLKETRDADTAARISGDEFAVILRRSDLREGVRIAERLRLTIKAIGPITVRIGVAEFPLSAGSWNELMGVAETAAFDARKRGGDRVSQALAKSEVDFSLVNKT